MSASWHVAARTALHDLADTGAWFSSDDVADRVGLPDSGHAANGRNSAMGSLFSQAAADGLIESDGRVVRSRQPHRKGGAVRMWRGRPQAPRLPIGGSPDATAEGGTP